MQDNLFQQGVELMVYGMGTVFTFLALLIVATTLMSYFVRRFVQLQLAAQPADTNPEQSADNDKQLIAVITAAIHKHRSRHN